jgi:hypothetical protein
MSILISQHKNIPISHRLKWAICAGIGATCLILALAIVYLFLLDSPQVVDCLSEVRVTPSWPQIGSFPSP